MKSGASAPMIEIFTSIQGEGLLVGRPQIFVRLARCNLSCSYCDTPESIGEPPAMMRFSVSPAATSVLRPNPIGVADALSMILRCREETPAVNMVSITGGEPLLHAQYLAELLPQVRAAGLATFLETSGLLASAMKSLCGLFDVLSIDLKLPGETGIPLARLLAKHREFIEVTGDAPQRYFKIVVTCTTNDQDLRALATLAAECAPDAPIFLTPVTCVEGGPSPPDFQRLLALAAVVAELAPDVRILPQVHALGGWR